MASETEGAQTTDIHPPKTFRDLPPELRLSIYEYVLDGIDLNCFWICPPRNPHKTIGFGPRINSYLQIPYVSSHPDVEAAFRAYLYYHAGIYILIEDPNAKEATLTQLEKLKAPMLPENVCRVRIEVRAPLATIESLMPNLIHTVLSLPILQSLEILAIGGPPVMECLKSLDVSESAKFRINNNHDWESSHTRAPARTTQKEKTSRLWLDTEMRPVIKPQLV